MMFERACVSDESGLRHWRKSQDGSVSGTIIL